MSPRKKVTGEEEGDRRKNKTTRAPLDGDGDDVAGRDVPGEARPGPHRRQGWRG